MITALAIFGCLFAGWLFYNDYFMAGIIMLLVSLLAWSFSDD